LLNGWELNDSEENNLFASSKIGITR